MMNIKNECYTPACFADPIREFANGFHLDPFSTAKANQTIKADSFFGGNLDALSLDWLEWVDNDYPNFWVNPPYSRDLIAKCISKTLSYIGRAEIYLLVNSSTNSQWYLECASKCQAVMFPHKRVQFYNPFIEFKHKNEYNQTLFFFGKPERAKEFTSELSHLGIIRFTELFSEYRKAMTRANWANWKIEYLDNTRGESRCILMNGNATTAKRRHKEILEIDKFATLYYRDWIPFTD